jgi:hypothetical protein
MYCCSIIRNTVMSATVSTQNNEVKSIETLLVHSKQLRCLEVACTPVTINRPTQALLSPRLRKREVVMRQSLGRYLGPSRDALPPSALSVADDLNLLPLFPITTPPSLHPPHHNHLNYTATFHLVLLHIAHHAWRPGWHLVGITRGCVACACQQHSQ